MPAASPRSSSLTLRLLGFAAASIAAALILAWLVLGYLFERHSERQLQAALERDAIALIAAIEPATEGAAKGGFTLERLPSDSRYSRPASGLYWQVANDQQNLRSRSLWDGALPAALGGAPATPDAPWQVRRAKGPFESEILLASRQVRRAGFPQAFTITVAADSKELREASAKFGRETAIFLGLLGLALAAAAWVQVRLGLKPLQSLRAHIQAMSRSADGRLPPENLPREIAPLTEAINHLADRRSQDIIRARQRAQDLAHALKTPLTALRLQLDNLPAAQAQEMEQSLAMLRSAVEGELARTSAADPAAAPAASSAPAALVDRLIAVLQRTPDGQLRSFENRLPADLHLPLSVESLSEILGAAMENAARHAKSRILISGGLTPDGSRWLSIADDGAGIAEADRDMVLGRGVRLDERGPHQGLGLSILHDYVNASGGDVALLQSELGGLDVRATWPASPSNAA